MPEQLKEIGKACGYPYEIREVDESSVFLVITKGNPESLQAAD